MGPTRLKCWLPEPPPPWPLWFRVAFVMWVISWIAGLVCMVSIVASAQSFDRLLLYPRSLGNGSYESGNLSWCGSSPWPVSDPECVSLSAPAIVARYGLALPVAAPGSFSCLLVMTDGQMYFETAPNTSACRQGTAFMSVEAATYLDETFENNSYEFNRENAALGGRRL